VAFLTAALAAALSYLAGSVSAAILVCRLRGLPDPRTEGSGNPGATNVLRVGGALGALLATDLTAGLLALLIWLAVCLAFRRSSLAALVTFALVPVLLLMEAQHTAAAAFAMISIGLFITHRANIQRLLDGTEPKLGDRAGAREQDR